MIPISIKEAVLVAALMGCAWLATAQSVQQDQVSGNLIQFNDNGAWTWYSDERAVVDRAPGKLIVAVDVSGSGLGGSPRNGAIDATLFDVPSGTSQRATLKGSNVDFGGCDDHDVPGLL